MRALQLVMLAAVSRALLRAARPLRPTRSARAYAAKGADDLASLEKELARHDNLYYNQAKPELTDEAYDALARKVDDLRTTPRGVGAKRGGTLVKAKPHTTPMLSLDTLKVKDGTGHNCEMAQKNNPPAPQKRCMALSESRSWTG